MSEISMYEAQKKKMEGLCDEHGLTYRFKKDCYPIVFILKPCNSMDAQMTMLENVEDEGFISPEASMTWIFADGALQTKVTGGTFTISKTLRTKIENILIKMITYWQQYFFRDVIERHAITEGAMPVIDESEDDTQEDPEETDAPLDELADDAAAELDELTEDDSPDGETEEAADQADNEDEAAEGLTTAELGQATAIIRMENKASPALLQRRMKGVNFAKAARILDVLEERGVVGPISEDGPREVLPVDAPEEGSEE